MQITRHVHALKIPFQVPITPERKVDRFVYVYLVYGKRIWLIDTGVAASERVIMEYIRKTGRDPKDIAGVLLTHSHPDHIGSLRGIREATGCVVAAHPAERNWIQDTDLQARERPVPGFHSLVQGSIRVDRVLNDGDMVQADDLNIEVIHTPGHSRGSISFLIRDEGVLFSGDAVPVEGDMPVYDDPVLSAASVQKLKNRGGIETLLASWDSPRTGEAAYKSLENGLRYLERLHDAVMKIAGESVLEPMELCKKVLSELGLPPGMANPLVAKSLHSHIPGY